MDTFVVMMKIPSVFRRLFAAGALNQALIPVLEITSLDEDQKRSADIAAQTSVITVIDCVQQ